MGIKGELKTKLSKEEILKRVSQYDIVRAFWPVNKEFKLNRAINSPFRKDENASFLIGTKYEGITYKDLGDYQYRGDVWNFVKQIERIDNFYDVLRAIDNKFSLGLGNGAPINHKPSIITWKPPVIEIINPPRFNIITRKPNREELGYWNKRYQDISDLKRENIFFPNRIYRNGALMPLGDLLTFCYYFEDIDAWKLYRPYAPKRNKNTPVNQRKWDSGIPFDYIENLKGISGKYGFITSSRKDRMVISKALGTNSICNGQAEDAGCFSDDVLAYIKTHSEIQVSVQDNDKKGIEFSWWLTKEHGYKHCNVPYGLKTESGKYVTDFDEMAITFGLDSVTKHFHKKGFL